MPYIQAMIPGKKTKPLDYLFLWLPNFAGQIRLFGVKLNQADCCIADYTYILDLFDIIGLYQHTWSTAVAQKSRRKQIWTSFGKLLKEIPNRNSLCVLGDFNCSLPSIPRLVGQAHFMTPAGNKLGPQHGDLSTLSQLMNGFQLVALNTWIPALGATSYTASGPSRIDHIMVRYRDADTSAKQVGMLTDAPFLHTGAYHVPMISSVNHKYFRQPRTCQTRFPRQVKDFCTTEFRQDTLHWQCCETGINYALRHATDLHELDDMYRILSQGRMHYFKYGKKMQSRTQSGFAVQKWHHYAQLRQPGTPDLQTLFIRWKHFSLFQKMERCIPGGSRKSNIPRSSSSPWRRNRLSTTRIISSLSCYHTCLPQTKNQENTPQK